jgi:hypothetical protein
MFTDKPIRQRILIWEFIAAANAAGGGLAAALLHRGGLFVALGVPLVVGALTLFLRCPRCGTPVMKRRGKWQNMEWTYWGGLTAPRACSQCGLSFEVVDSGGSGAKTEHGDSPNSRTPV